MKKKPVLGIILRTALSLIFLSLALWFMLPLKDAIYNIGNILGLFLSVCGLAAAIFWDKLINICKRLCRRKIGKLALIALVSIVSIGIGYVAVISGFMIAAALDPPDEGSTVVVLGCKVNGAKPSLMLERRLEAAYEYLNEHETAVCIVSGGQGSNEGISEAQCMYNYLTEKGISPERVIMENKSSTTSENLEFSKEIIDRYGLSENIAIATDGFHELRASIIAEKAGLNPTGAVSAETPAYLLATYHFRETIAVLNELIFG